MIYHHHDYHSAKRPPRDRSGNPHKLHVIAVISNVRRYQTRFALFKQFEEDMLSNKDVDLIVVEAAFGDRPFEVTCAGNPNHVQLRIWDEVWHKENMINIGVQHLLRQQPLAEFVAFIDADVKFLRSDWAVETMHMLQHHMVVQMWQHAIDLGPDGSQVATHHSFLHQYCQKKPYCYGSPRGAYHKHWHPGYAWAMRIEAWHHLGGLIETAILGAGDNHMAHALVGLLDFSCAKGLHPNYYKHLNIWGKRAERFIRRDVGVVAGTITHFWHGKKRDRRYHDRWKILVEHQYDPDMDLKRDAQGLFQLCDHGDVRSIRFRDDMRNYFQSRNEDSIDIE